MKKKKKKFLHKCKEHRKKRHQDNQGKRKKDTWPQGPFQPLFDSDIFAPQEGICFFLEFGKLDNGWPEGVKEQRFHFRNNLWMMCYRQLKKGVSRQDSKKCKTIVCIADTFYTQTCLHADAFTHRRTILDTDSFTHKHSEDTLKSQFYLSFWRSNLILCKRVAIGF